MATLPAHHPKIPYVGRISNAELRHGDMIRIQGCVSRKLSGYERFSISLLCDPSIKPLGDVPLHLDVRVSDHIITRNHHTGHMWGMEESTADCPIRPGEEYEILILAQTNLYKIAINGRHFCEFYHRLPMSRVQYVYVNGDTHVNFIRVEQDARPGGIPTAPPLGFIPPPTQYMPNYAAPPYNPPPAYSNPPYNPGVYNPAPPVIHQPILTSPPYNPHAPIPAGNVPPPPYTNYPAPNPQGYGGSGGGVVMMNKEYLPDNDKKTKKIFKYAAIAGGVGLGAYALSRIITDSDSD